MQLFMDDTLYLSGITRPALVTVSGSPGSGKSTAARTACERLGGTRLYAGQILRDKAKDAGMTLEQFIEYAVNHSEIDRTVDLEIATRAQQLYSEGKIVIVEGRTQFHFLPRFPKCYIFTELQEGARRILEDLQVNASARNESVCTQEEMEARVTLREQTDAERYLSLYGFDHRDRRHYDCIVDSTMLTKEGVVSRLLRFIYQSQQAALAH